MYNILPETENRSLEDIEIHFSDKTKKITNYKIAKLDLSHKNNNDIKIDQHPSPTNQPDETTMTNNIKRNGCDNRGFVNDH